MGNNNQGILVLDNIWWGQYVQCPRGSHLHTISKRCLTKIMKSFSITDVTFKKIFDCSIDTYFSWVIGFTLDVTNQVFWHFWRKIFSGIIIFGNPAIDFVQFEENARRRFMIIKIIFSGAWFPTFYVNVTHTTFGWRIIVAARINSFTLARCRTRYFINWKNLIQN